MDWRTTLFKRLTEAPGAPGFETPVRRIMKEYVEAETDETVSDHLGGFFGVKRGAGEGPVILAAGHMDEVAFLTKMIDKNGFIRFQTLGGWWSQVMLAQRVRIITADGPVEGVIGSIPPHNLSPDQRKKPMKIENMFIDIGADDREDAERMGIRPGLPVIPVCPFQTMGNEKKLLAKAWDNRYGCALSIELLRELKEKTHPNVVYAGATVQEEVGLRGAAVAAQMIEPDVFFAMDASPAGDIPGSKEGFGKLGRGFLLRIFDRTMVTHPGLRDYIIDTAETHNIPYQYYISQGGTDAGRVHTTGRGVPSAVIGIPARYIHSHVSIIHMDDYLAAKEILIRLIEGMDRNTLEQIKAR